VVNSASPETYCDVFERLELEEVRYVVIGGVAVALHGHARPVADLDIIVDPAPEEAARALHALTCAGFVPTLLLPLSMLSVLRLFDRSRREVNVFVRDQIPFEELWAVSERRRVGGVDARVEALEHLLRAKRATGRPHDLLDVAGLLALNDGGGSGEGPA
jgi:hypothetical protein